jgi:ABC-2 type transport system ATP-binding protein
MERKTTAVRDNGTAIRVRGLRKAYGGRVAVDGVDLDVRTGEIFALLGPNGAGKTTTTEILEGQRDRDAGEVAVLGVDPARAGGAWRSRIGIVLQESKDFTELTVREIVRHFALYYPAPRDPDEVIEAVGLADKATSRTARLSGGQRRRLDVALGILGDPELLFLDEPTTGFDPEVRRRFWDLVAGLRAAGTTILLTTHYLDEAEHLADRVGVLTGGRIVDVDTPDRLGGRHLAPATVRWTENGAPRVAHTDRPTALLRELAARFAGPDGTGEVPDLLVDRPSLEETYLRLIGEAA